MKVLDLFSGIGGFSLGLERAGMQTTAFCEVNEFCRKVLKKHWPDVPIFEDVRTLKGEDVGTIDLICGGYPCQPFSVAGKRRGQDDDRHLWPEVLRLIQETNPRWFIGENVAGHISMGLDQVLLDLASEGYEAQTFIIPACAIDAPHRRNRVWIVANSELTAGRRRRDSSDSNRQEWSSTKEGRKSIQPKDGEPYTSNPQSSCKAVADSCAERLQKREVFTGRKREKEQPQQGETFKRNDRWPTEPAVGRVADGVPRRVDRLRSLGNAVVPQIPEMIGRAIMAAEELECMGDSRCTGMTHEGLEL